MKRFLSVLLAFMMIIPTIAVSSFAEEAKAVSFKDIDSTTARGQAIIKLATAGVLAGYPDGTFKPDQPITRGELSKVINLIFNYTETDPEMFSDVSKEDWYYNQVAIAKKAGYIKGYEDGTFRGDNNMTREEACTILKRVGGLYDLGIPAGVTDAVSEWAVPYVNAVIISGFMTLEAGNTFRATEKITRGEFCEAFAKFVQIKEPEVVPPADDEKEEDKKEEDKGNNNSTSGNNNSTSGNNNSNSDDNSSDDNNSEEDNSSDNSGDDAGEGENDYSDIEEINYEELNAEAIENLNSALEDLQNFYAIEEYEEKLVNIGIECINIIMPYTLTDEITSDFIREKCKAQIKKADDVRDGMTIDEMRSFYTTAIPEFRLTTVEYLSDLFNIDFKNLDF